MPTPKTAMRSKPLASGKSFAGAVQAKPKDANVPDSAQCAPSGPDPVRQHFKLAGGRLR